MKKLFIVAFALLFTGCVSVVKPLDTKYSPEPQHSFVYADLLVADDSNSIFGRMTVAIALLNTDTTQVTYLPLKRKETAYIVQIAPGNYKVKGVAFLDHYNNKSGEKPLNIDLHFTAKQGTMYYLGDYKGKAESTLGSFQTKYWELSDIRNNFTETTSNIHTLYPAFTKLDAINVFSID